MEGSLGKGNESVGLGKAVNSYIVYYSILYII